MEALQGILERIVFENAETGYTIGRLSSREYPNELITVVGNLASANAGESVLLKGIWTNNPKYGKQFQIEGYETVLPATVVGLRKYLGSGLIKGIGPVMAGRIVNCFGMDTMEVIEGAPKKLMKVPGIGKKRVDMIMEAWEAQREVKNVMLFLQSHNVSTTHAAKIYKTYQSESVPIVRENPYRLADDIYGIGFKTADTIAEKLGMDSDSPHRVTAGLKYVLSQKADDGHVFLYRHQLIAASQEILGVPTEAIENGIAALSASEEIIPEKLGIPVPTEAEEAIYLAPFYYSEIGAANNLSRVLKFHATQYNPGFLDHSISQLENAMGMSFATKQREAIRKALTSRVMILTGGPGTGKTTTTIGIIHLFEQLGRRITLAAPTGRAAKRLSETTRREAKTIHRLLEFSPQENGFKRNAENPLETDVVIIDEISMLDLVLMNNLLKAVPSESMLIFVGDVDQLPSVGAGNVLKDLIASDKIAIVRLTEIFRQARKSLIVINAHRVNRGRHPKVSGPADRNFFFIEEADSEEVSACICNLVRDRLPKHYDYHPMDDIQVLCPMRRGTVGTDNLNRRLQETLNTDSAEAVRGGRNFRVGDKVMQVRNNYDYDVFNGDIGRVHDVDSIEKQVLISFPDRVVCYDMADLNELVLAYATTVHKAQGSEYPAVVIPLLTQHYMMLQRNLLYTAITRAKELVVIVGTKEALGIALRNNKVVERNSHLAGRIRGALEETGGVVGLPAPDTTSVNGDRVLPNPPAI
ncbi:MAG: ATP-dependent RecD-like DNA helicase [Candidatus Poribacteria bacterium]|nr:ATP-dependent RecD-like DNA helicase [Candidatus Poribacteria bacterium]